MWNLFKKLHQLIFKIHFTYLVSVFFILLSLIDVAYV